MPLDARLSVTARISSSSPARGRLIADPCSVGLGGRRTSFAPTGSRRKKNGEQGEKSFDFPIYDTDWEGEAYFTVSGQLPGIREPQSHLNRPGPGPGEASGTGPPSTPAR